MSILVVVQTNPTSMKVGWNIKHFATIMKEPPREEKHVTMTKSRNSTMQDMVLKCFVLACSYWDNSERGCYLKRAGTLI